MSLVDKVKELLGLGTPSETVQVGEDAIQAAPLDEESMPEPTSDMGEDMNSTTEEGGNMAPAEETPSEGENLA